MNFDSMAQEALFAFIAFVGAWAVMRSQLADLRERVPAQDKALTELGLKVQRLETQHEGTSHTLDEAVRKLEEVTKTLQSIALDIARNTPAR